MKPIQGSIVALVTPMHDDGRVDYDTLRALIDWHLSEGTHCIGVVGTTGESPTVSTEEHCEIVRVTVEHVAGRVPVLAGTGSNCTREAINLARHAKAVGADAQLSVVPYYNKPSQEGIFQHFKALADATDLPLMLYNVPGRTIADMSAETSVRCAALPHVFGTKEASGNVERTAQILKSAPTGFSFYSGDDGSGLASMFLGGRGIVSVTANVAPRLMSQMCTAALGGDWAQAKALNNQLLDLHRTLFCEPSPAPAKWALSRLGRCPAHVRLPLLSLSPGGQDAVEAAMRSAHLL
ncbi:4-hydroxy-tetrahydrodipicolinate synthase [Inhella gelatinilytica]|uniref:4-hydroxy-tetrahydrodipicolinate synthase n=1 Tax=Inhella gelatinilytica TaxID=2795030 RepID=A0A931IY23_9BURK|nr:4-hydroxy-tetrahydrodipicolinate synthase [Inhella gelatinilytica]MBH9554274.1 4-hydroxy-tetrahydrodipicolinate synthase [Inhella gelatinilytica]